MKKEGNQQSSVITSDILQQFVDWTKRKIRHHFDKPQEDIYFYEGQVWWVALGKNIGYEADGKHEYFSRPVLILKKYSSDMCFVVPLTTQVKTPYPWYQVPIHIGEKDAAINISQGRAISTNRFLDKEGSISPELFKKVCEDFKKQF